MRAIDRISLDFLKVFHAVARLGSMTAAASSLCVTQPAVSHAISQLESDLECRLFIRKGRRVQLTAEGEAVYASTQKIFTELDALHERLEEIRLMKTGLVRIGCPFLILQTFLSEHLSRFHRRWPGIRVKLTIENRMQPMLDLLRSGKVDLLFLATPTPVDMGQGWQAQELGAYRYCFIANEHHYPQLRGRQLALSELNDFPLIILRRSNHTRDWMEKRFSREGLRLNVQYETETMALTEEYVRSGFGIGCVLRQTEPHDVPPEPPFFEVRTEETFEAGHYAVVHPSRDQLSSAVSTFLDAVESTIAQARGSS